MSDKNQNLRLIRRFLNLAPPARLELTTSRLGGVRSIQVSYGGVLTYFTQFLMGCQEITA